MSGKLRVAIGQYSDRGHKEVNQDFYGALTPEEPDLGLKGVAIAIADGVSSSDVSEVAAESAVKSFLSDYYCTSPAWSAKTAARRVIAAANSWLHAQNQRSFRAYEKDRGYVTTFDALVIKGAQAHLFHVGDSRIYRVSGAALEQLTEDHRVVISSKESYLGRALGVNAQVEIDYRAESVSAGDVYILATDGVYDFVEPSFVVKTIRAAADLDAAARAIGEEALARGSDDNLTIQIVRIDETPRGGADDALRSGADLPSPPMLEARQEFDGYRIVRRLHASARSHIYLAEDIDSGAVVVLKAPSVDLRDDPGYLRRFMLEEWVARRLSSAYVLKPSPVERRRNFLYVAFEYVEGQTLAQWMIDNPRPPLSAVRDIVDQVARGLTAFHRKEMVHQDLRPANVMIDRTGTAKIIDFGSTRVAGVAETASAEANAEILGTVQYTAPEYFLGEGGSARSDVYSLAAVAYHMLTGRLPYGAQVAHARTRAQMKRLAYTPAGDDARAIPAWVDGALRKALSRDPAQRFAEPLEFAHALRNPVVDGAPARLIERDPLKFWKFVSGGLATLVVVLACLLARR
ncbi:MAG TPA: bifunctional protein-serine/threonine kinase/phosphatase [Rhodoblastus sp.]|nr:bifunctional protein-serine/threonine kinase/phosphatase [Rhodoblastus sp.]